MHLQPSTMYDPPHGRNHRVKAVYHGNPIVPVVMIFLFLVMVGVNAWLLTTGERELISLTKKPELTPLISCHSPHSNTWFVLYKSWS